jgi:hypothetical protein
MHGRYGPAAYDPIPGYERPWLKDRAQEVVFLTPDPFNVRQNHYIQGNVYVYEVPNDVIKEAGGIHFYCGAAEVLIPKNLWPRVEFLGKMYDRKEFEKLNLDTYKGMLRRFSPSVKPVTDKERDIADRLIKLHNQKHK